jgi:uncharacterized membrane protein
MFDVFTIVKWIHILMAIIAVGFNASYGVWLARAAASPEFESYALEGIKFLDRIANIAYALLLVTGVWMVAISPFELTTFWIAAALVLYAVALVLGIAVYAPSMRKQRAALETEGRDSPTYRQLADRNRAIGIFLAIDVVIIVFLMVTKPTV